MKLWHDQSAINKNSFRDKNASQKFQYPTITCRNPNITSIIVVHLYTWDPRAILSTLKYNAK